LNLFVRAGKDFVIAVPSTDNLSTTGPNDVFPTLEETKKEFHYESLIDSTQPVIPKDMCFGEDLVTIKDFTMRQGLFTTIPVGSALQIDHVCGYPPDKDNKNFLPYFKNYYRYWRGTMMTTMMPGGSTGVYVERDTAKLINFSRYTNITKEPDLSTMNKGCQLYPYYITSYNFLTVATPYYYPQAFQFNTLSGAQPMEEIKTLTTIQSTDKVAIRISEQIGDDFHFGCCIGVPTLKHSKNIVE